MAGLKVVILEDACASQSFDGFSAQDAHRFALARFRYRFGQTMTAREFSDLADGLSADCREERAAMPDPHPTRSV